MATTHSQNPADHRDPAEGHHPHGTADVTDHQRTFNGFVRVVAWNVVAMAAVLIFLALSNA